MIVIIITITKLSGDPLDGHFLFQWISVLIQCFNLILFHETLPTEDWIDAFQQVIVFFVFNPEDFYCAVLSGQPG